MLAQLRQFAEKVVNDYLFFGFVINSESQWVRAVCVKVVLR